MPAANIQSFAASVGPETCPTRSGQCGEVLPPAGPAALSASASPSCWTLYYSSGGLRVAWCMGVYAYLPTRSLGRGPAGFELRQFSLLIRILSFTHFVFLQLVMQRL